MGSVTALDDTRIGDEFHRLWYDGQVWTRLTWFGVPIQKNPFDLFQYQEILHARRPDYVIECGAFEGGSALYFAHLLDLIGHGTVISVDLEGRWHRATLEHPRVVALHGSSVAPDILAEVRALVPPGASSFVILDSDHSAPHVLAELRAYQGYPQVGDYLIVEDGNINGHPVLPGWGAGPYEAVEEFLRETDAFVLDAERDSKMRFTFAPAGWLRRVA